MRDAAGQVADRLHLLRLAQLRLGGLARGDLAREREDPRRPGDPPPSGKPRPSAGCRPGCGGATRTRPFAALRLLDAHSALRCGVGRHAGADVVDGQAAELVDRIAVGPARLRIHVDERAGIPVVDEDRVLARLEDRAVARLGCAQRLLGARARSPPPRAPRRSSASPRPARRRASARDPSWRSARADGPPIVQRQAA